MDNNTIFDPIAWAAATDNNSKPASNANDQIKGQVQNPQPAVLDVGKELEKAKAAVEELLLLGGNIAESYNDWWECGCALAELGTVRLTVRKNGRNAFRSVMVESLSQLFTKWHRRLA